MKVVLFCGGEGMRIRDYSEEIPKPMIKLGYRPILWNVMKYYAHFGHKDFILCLGYKGDYIKRYFVNYEEYASNNFVLKGGNVEFLSTDIDDWNITFVDTGMATNIGQRLMKVRPYLEGEEEFLANYSDGLTDMPLNTMIDEFHQVDKAGSFMAYQPTQSFHVADVEDDGSVNNFSPISNSGLCLNTGYFILKQEFFNYMEYGDDLVRQPFQRLIGLDQLHGYKYDGFWACMDTFKDKKHLDDRLAEGHPPWEVWERNGRVNGKIRKEVKSA